MSQSIINGFVTELIVFQVIEGEVHLRMPEDYTVSVAYRDPAEIHSVYHEVNGMKAGIKGLEGIEAERFVHYWSKVQTEHKGLDTDWDSVQRELNNAVLNEYPGIKDQVMRVREQILFLYKQ
jgi:hypothetical protein